MAAMLSPGVFITEEASQTQVTSSVSVSALGMVGFTPKGPTDVATRVTSWADYLRKFGGFSANSLAPVNWAAFFNNGGQVGYVVRVVPADAVKATAKVISVHSDQIMNVGDGVAATVTNAVLTPTPFAVNSGSTPLVPSAATFRWRGSGSFAAASALKKRDGSTAMVGDTAALKFDGRINPSAIPAVDPGLLAVVPKVTGDANPTTLKWVSGAANKTLTLVYPNLAATSNPVVSGTNGAGTTATLDHRTGIISILFVVAEVPDAAAITLDMTPAGPTLSLTDNGSGVLPAGSLLTGAGSINYNTGAYSFTTTAGANVPHKGGSVLCTYSIYAWSLSPVSKGAWANDVRLAVQGSLDWYTPATATYSKHNVLVGVYNSVTGLYDTVETYTDVVMGDATSADFWLDQINAVSSTLTIASPGGNESPLQLNGLARRLVLAGGDETSGGQVVSATLGQAPLQVRTLEITYTDNTSAARTIKDDGVGGLTGDIDASGTNAINYTTGVLSLKTVAPIKAGTLITAVYRSVPAESTHYEKFGDSVKSYVAGSDGTFDSVNYGRDQFSVSTLAAATQTLGNGQVLTGRGLYALTQVEDLMQIGIPDFAGNLTITGDILDYVDGRALLAPGGDRFAILTVPRGSTAQAAVDWFRYSLARQTSFAALYWPWIKVADPLSNSRVLTVPPIGHVAGIYARTDANRNVSKAPAGVNDGSLRFLVGLETRPTQEDCDLVYPNRINPLKDSIQAPRCVFGARTMSNVKDFQFVPVRRFLMYLERTIYNNTHWICFEPNGPALWNRITTQIKGFFRPLFEQGYFAGTSPETSYSVKCDEENNPKEAQDEGQVTIQIGVATTKPAEFINFRINQNNNLG